MGRERAGTRPWVEDGRPLGGRRPTFWRRSDAERGTATWRRCCRRLSISAAMSRCRRRKRERAERRRSSGTTATASAAQRLRSRPRAPCRRAWRCRLDALRRSSCPTGLSQRRQQQQPNLSSADLQDLWQQHTFYITWHDVTNYTADGRWIITNSTRRRLQRNGRRRVGHNEQTCLSRFWVKGHEK